MSAALTAEGLHTYYGKSHILHGVSLQAAEGKITALLGRNGAGKSTTLRSLMGLTPVREGKITIFGEDTTRRPTFRIAALGVGYVPEERGIFASLTVSENLTLPPAHRPGGMSLDEIYKLFPNLAERRSNSGAKLSGGEQQMLAIARILRTGANLILLDEPTEGLAPVVVNRIGDVLHLLKAQGLTIVIVEQNLHFARTLADRYVVIENGRTTDHFAAAEFDAKLAGLSEQLGL